MWPIKSVRLNNDNYLPFFNRPVRILPPISGRFIRSRSLRTDSAKRMRIRHAEQRAAIRMSFRARRGGTYRWFDGDWAKGLSFPECDRALAGSH